MAKGININIPVAIEDEIKKSVIFTREYQSDVCIAHHSIYGNKRRKKKRANKLHESATRCAESIYRENAGSLNKTEKEMYILAVANEIEGGIFREEWFTELGISSQVVEITEPVCGPYTFASNTNGGNPPITRQICTYGEVTRSYPVPPPLSGLPDPSPGSSGVVIGSTWHDIYSAQQRTIFEGINRGPWNDNRYLFIKTTIELQGESSHQGMKMWMSPCVSGWPNNGAINNGRGIAMANIKSIERTRYRIMPPSSSSSYQWLESKTFVYDYEEIAKSLEWSIEDGITIVVGVPPASGMFFGANNQANVYLNIGLELYLYPG